MPTLFELEALKNPPGTLKASTSLFESATAVVVSKMLPLADVLNGIRTGQWENEVESIRHAVRSEDRQRAEYLKRKLPAFTVSAALRTRAKDANERVITHTGWLQADFDAKDNLGMVTADAREALAADPHVGAVFVGPSGAGIKALIRIDSLRHSASVDAAIAYCREKFGLVMDKACRDIERLCFVSHDPAAWMRSGPCEVLPVPDTQPAAESSRTVPAGAPAAERMPIVEWTKQDMREVLSFLPKTRPDYETWLRVISGVSSVLPFQDAVEVLQEWMPEERPGEYAEKWKARLQHVTHRTVIRMAQANGFDAAAAARRKRWMGRVLIDGRAVGGPAPDNSDLLEADPEPDMQAMWDTYSQLKNQQFGDASLFAAKMGHQWKYDALKKRWRHYRPGTGLWELDEANSALLVAAAVARDAYCRLAETIEEEKKSLASRGSESDRRAEIKARDAELKELNGRLANLGKAGWCEGVMKFAERMPSTLCRATDFDQKRHLLAVQNGVIDFAACRFIEHDREHRLAAAANVEYVPGAQCPHFAAFLDTCMGGDADLIAYLWRIIGYSLTGLVDHDALFFCYGTGANGKSTFFLVLRMLMGDSLSTVVDVATLLGGSSESGSTVDYKKSMLEGKRLVLTDEIPEDRKFNESMVKQLLGGEDIVARRPYEMPYTFSPTHKIWAVGNHKPRIKGTDHGIWRRMHLIPWTVTIPPEKRKPRHEMMEHFRRELPGILNGALRGYNDFLDRGGLEPPPAVLAATEEYRQEEDSLGSYLADRIVRAPMASLKLTDMLKDYLAWCEEAGEYPTVKSAKKLASMLKDRGFRTEQDRNKCAHVVGAALLLAGANPALSELTPNPF